MLQLFPGMRVWLPRPVHGVALLVAARNLALVVACLAAGSDVSYAQVSITGMIAGSVTDTSQAVLPNVTVTLTDEGTGIQKITATNASGAFAFRDLNLGSYQVTVALQEFQTAIYNKVIVEAGRTTDVRVELAIGALKQSVTVEGRTPLLERTSNVISSTLTDRDLNELPLGGRNVFSLARLVPGAVTLPGGTQLAGTRFNGMPGGTINPTIDGVNTSSVAGKSGGASFSFSLLPVRLGAVEQISVETAGLDAGEGVTGGVNLKFVTRRGTNQYRGSLFEQYRTDKLNANTFGNAARGLPKNKLRRHDFGGNFGGPVMRGGPLGNKLFAFVNWEAEWIPGTQTRTQTTLTEEARLGVFRYTTASGEQRTVDVFEWAAAAGLQATPDPVIAALLAKQSQAKQYAAIESGRTLRNEVLSWRERGKQLNSHPTVRVDHQIKNDLSFMSSINRFKRDPDGRRLWPIPDFPITADTFESGGWVWSSGANWTIGPSMHSELRIGIRHNSNSNGESSRREIFELNGFVNGLPARFSLPLVSPLVNDSTPSDGADHITTVANTFTYVRRNHTYTFGGNFRDTQRRERSWNGVNTGGYLGLPRYTIGVATGDPLASVFSTSTIPGLSPNDQQPLQELYALLTGRLREVRIGRAVDAATLRYSDEVPLDTWTSAWFAGVFAQDSWRIKENVTLNYGLRYEINAPPFAHNGIVAFPDDANIFGPSTRLFHPGELNGVQDPVFQRGKVAAKTNWLNLAPRVGFAWSPDFGRGVLGTLFGRDDSTVFRGHWDITYYDEGTAMFSSTAGLNPGRLQVGLLQPGMPGFEPGGLTLQSPLPPFLEAPAAYQDVWKQSELTFTSPFFAMFNDLKTGRVQSWNIGIQRQVASNTVLEVRYLGNRSANLWHQFNFNEVNIFENGFLDDFKRAQQNLAINEANGRTGFANNGLPGQAGIPVFEAAFGARGGQPALPANQAFTNGNFINDLRQGQAGRLAARLAISEMYLCRMIGNTFSPCAVRNYGAPGPHPMNVFTANPYATFMNVVDDDGWSRYDAVQFQLRRRYANWLTATVNYTLGKSTGNLHADSATQSGSYFTLRDKARSDGPLPYDVRHVLQAFGTYDLPFGRGRHWRIGNGLINGLAGGWTFGALFTAQSGARSVLTSGRQTVNGSDAGVVLMNGHTVEEIRNMITIRPGRQPSERYYLDERLIGPDGRANPEYLAPPTTPGEWGQVVYLPSPKIWSLDASFNKTTALIGRAQITVHVTIENMLNQPVWGLLGLHTDDITSTAFGQLTDPANHGTPRSVYSRVTVRF